MTYWREAAAGLATKADPVETLRAA